MSLGTIIFLVIIIGLVFYLIAIYNGLVTSRNQFKTPLRRSMCSCSVVMI